MGEGLEIKKGICQKGINEKDAKILEAIHRICDKGGNVQIKRNSDGSLKVQEIKIHTIVG